MKFYSQTYTYNDPWPIVTLAYFLRYPNPLAAHILSCDVVSRHVSPATGNLHTTRLILKRSAVGRLPKWLPANVVPRSESWVLEESEVDPFGCTVSSKTCNLDHQKVMRMEEHVHFRLHPSNDRHTIQTTEARIFSNFGWGLTKRIEGYGLAKFKSNIERSREGVSIILALLRESKNGLGLRPMGLGGSDPHLRSPGVYSDREDASAQASHPGRWSVVKSWLWRSPPSA
ncbi:PRELI-like family-domain-containing protein [Flagelloscypha sp. PMI_526]|nr:PRELI-like family-domain-containing protein [Flagelloscypha sp. PMI_526]